MFDSIKTYHLGIGTTAHKVGATLVKGELHIAYHGMNNGLYHAIVNPFTFKVIKGPEKLEDNIKLNPCMYETNQYWTITYIDGHSFIPHLYYSYGSSAEFSDAGKVDSAITISNFGCTQYYVFPQSGTNSIRICSYDMQSKKWMPILKADNETVIGMPVTTNRLASHIYEDEHDASMNLMILSQVTDGPMYLINFNLLGSNPKAFQIHAEDDFNCPGSAIGMSGTSFLMTANNYHEDGVITKAGIFKGDYRGIDNDYVDLGRMEVDNKFYTIETGTRVCLVGIGENYCALYTHRVTNEIYAQLIPRHLMQFRGY